MRTKTFDCVEMKRKAAARLYETIKDMSVDQEGAYWQKINEAFLKRQEERRAQRADAPPSE